MEVDIEERRRRFRRWSLINGVHLLRKPCRAIDARLSYFVVGGDERLATRTALSSVINNL